MILLHPETVFILLLCGKLIYQHNIKLTIQKHEKTIHFFTYLYLIFVFTTSVVKNEVYVYIFSLIQIFIKKTVKTTLILKLLTNK